MRTISKESVNTLGIIATVLAVAWILVILGTQAFGGPVTPELNLDRAIAIDGVIMGGNLTEVGNALTKFSNEGTGPIDIAINSPGGSVTTGFLFVNTMEAVKAKGVKLRCFVNGIAASMAFQILTHCDERYALSRSFLLWHRVRTGVEGIVTAPLAEALYSSLQSIDDVILSEVRAVLAKDLKDEVILYHFEHETLHIGSNLAKLTPSFLSVYSSVPNLMEAFTDKRVVKSKIDMGFFGRGGFRPGEIYYMYGEQ